MKFLKLTSIKPSRGMALAAVAVLSALAVGATFSSVFNFRSSGGSLSAYLIGAANGRNHTCFGTACGPTYDPLAGSDTIEVVVRLGNPTNVALKAIIAVYRDGDTFRGCVQKTVDPNAYRDVKLVQLFGLYDTEDFTVKVLTRDFANKVQAGVKGWLTHFTAETFDSWSQGNTFSQNRFLHMHETELKEVPHEVLRAGEADKLIALLPDCLPDT